MPTFDHQFTAANGTVTTNSVSLTVQEIEDAGVLEILQSPGATLGHWQFLGALLDPSVGSFSFLQPLGHAREVKTAISGLFGRFVARAYATRHLGLTHFAHVRKPPMALGGVMQGQLRRVPNRRGDMPDWVAWGASTGMAIVEAKGCHDGKGPQAALDRAYTQANRAEIRIGRRRAPFKRYAIATRWGFSSPTVSAPMLWVRDPDEEAEISDAERESLEVAMARWHIASLLTSLGHAELAKPLVELTRHRFKNKVAHAQAQARAVLSELTPMMVDGDAAPEQPVIGGYVGRAGLLSSGPIDESEIAVLRKLSLRPTFVGVELDAIKRAIEGITPRGATDGKTETLRDGEDGAGSWVIRLDADERRVAPLARRT
ncbi:hypothetical protein ACQKJZ_10975 [Sphingomonas sp. NPDC019816]|uniref:Uncharacterized protein n=1 Tax=Paracoccus denitrificans TaxID=266 RepID=A0A533HYJ0_PARDE|nr:MULTISPECIES: hypothetical protein [Alphaproteobacteria]TAJ29114.1 MAG: hypothetical protein EPO59_15825 [Bosea sp. (in: a-proteobacteria)]TKW63823.1 MAG: hypothetical protein DI616_19125 [Paracoccus denitrificans]